MARFTHLLPFSPLYDFQASKPVTINGVAYRPGDRISTEARDALGPRRLQKLYEARQVTPVQPEVLPSLLTAKAEQRPDDAAPGEQLSGDTVDGDTLPPADVSLTDEGDTQDGEPTGVKIEHRGFGKWYATMPDGTVQGPMTKDQAEALLTA